MAVAVGLNAIGQALEPRVGEHPCPHGEVKGVLFFQRHRLAFQRSDRIEQCCGLERGDMRAI